MTYNLSAPFERIHPRITEWVDDIMDTVGRFDDVGHTSHENVENEPRDGFWPYTDGGVEGIAYAELSMAHGTGAIPKTIQPYIDSSLKDIAEAWDEKHPEMTYEMIFAADDPDQLTLSPEMARDREQQREDWREKYNELEDEWMREGGTYFYKVRALYYGVGNSNNTTGEPEVYFFVGINTDFEYGRDNIPWLACMGGTPQQSKWKWERTVKVRDCTPSLLTRLTKPAIRALENC